MRTSRLGEVSIPPKDTNSYSGSQVGCRSTKHTPTCEEKLGKIGLFRKTETLQGFLWGTNEAKLFHWQGFLASRLCCSSEGDSAFASIAPRMRFKKKKKKPLVEMEERLRVPTALASDQEPLLHPYHHPETTHLALTS